MNCEARWQNFISAGCNASEASFTADSRRAVEIVIFVVMEGITFIARSLGIRKNIILGFFFLVTKEKEGGNSPRNKDPGSL